MPGATTPITPREKAVILAVKMGILPDIQTAFINAHDSAVKDAPIKSLKSYSSKWWNSEKVTTFAAYIDRLIADRDADARRRGAEEAEKKIFGGGDQGESERTTATRAKAVDYYDPANQRREINRIIAESGNDPKTQLDAIKAIQQTQRDDRQAAQDRRQVQAFLPMRCQNCPLYERAKPKK